MNKSKNTIYTVKEYLRIKNERNNMTFKICPDGTSCYIKKGVKFTKAEIDALLPLPASLIVRHNCDRTMAWMNGKKSY